MKNGGTKDNFEIIYLTKHNISLYLHRFVSVAEEFDTLRGNVELIMKPLLLMI